jgi:hypothetical protein
MFTLLVGLANTSYHQQAMYIKSDTVHTCPPSQTNVSNATNQTISERTTTPPARLHPTSSSPPQTTMSNEPPINQSLEVLATGPRERVVLDITQLSNPGATHNLAFVNALAALMAVIVPLTQTTYLHFTSLSPP